MPPTPYYWPADCIDETCRLNLKRRHEPRKAGWQGAGKFYKLYYKRTPEILRLYNILWRWSSGYEAQEHLLETYWTNLGKPHL